MLRLYTCIRFTIFSWLLCHFKVQLSFLKRSICLFVEYGSSVDGSVRGHYVGPYFFVTNRIWHLYSFRFPTKTLTFIFSEFGLKTSLNFRFLKFDKRFPSLHVSVMNLFRRHTSLTYSLSCQIDTISYLITTHSCLYPFPNFYYQVHLYCSDNLHLSVSTTV